ncbi:hypothetical protein CPB86DRAFT_821040, partial [Serendipita vermifera]
MDDTQNEDQTSNKSEISDEVELSARKWQLQREILALRRIGANPENNPLLSIKKSAYNEVMDTLHSLHQGTRVDPMDKLPHEIWADILLQISVARSSVTWF